MPWSLILKRYIVYFPTICIENLIVVSQNNIQADTIKPYIPYESDTF